MTPRQSLAIILAAAAMAPAAMAQTLNKEITVERDIVPEHRDVDRLRLTPVITMPAATAPGLDFSMGDKPVGVAPTVTTLGLPMPVLRPVDNYRGYVSAGIMPVFNAGLSAGYRILDTQDTRLGAWLQYNGTVYKGTYPRPGSSADGVPESERTFRKWMRRHSASAGADFSHRWSDADELQATIAYTFARYNTSEDITEEYSPNFNQNVNRFNALFDWRHTDRSGLSYGLGGAYTMFGFVKDIPDSQRKPARQHDIRFQADAFLGLGEGNSAGITAAISSVSGKNIDKVFEDDWADVDKNQLLVRLTPAYRYDNGALSAVLGANLDISHGTDKNFHASPAAKATLRFGDSSRLSVSATGGMVQNTLASLYDISPYMSMANTYYMSNVPYDLNANLLLGPSAGVYLEIFGGYAKANNWLMPSRYFLDSNYLRASYEPVDIRGWHVGVTLGYTAGKTAEMKITGQMASHSKENETRGWYLWRDRAKYVIEAMARVNATDRLSLSGTYTFRGGRNCPFDYYQCRGAVSTLSIGATYRINDALSVFANGDNLFNRTYVMIGNAVSQGITGLAGVSYRF